MLFTPFVPPMPYRTLSTLSSMVLYSSPEPLMRSNEQHAEEKDQGDAAPFFPLNPIIPAQFRRARHLPFISSLAYPGSVAPLHHPHPTCCSPSTLSVANLTDFSAVSLSLSLLNG